MSNNIQLMLADFNQKLRLEPHNPDLYNNIASLYYRIHQIDKAIYYYQRSLNINPDNWQGHFNLANCYVQKNLIPDAIAHYQKSIQLNSENTDAIQNLGMLLVDTKNFSEALPYLEKSFMLQKTNQTHLEFIEQLANCYLQLGNISKAIEHLQIAITVNPNQESAQHNLAILYLREKDYVLAAKHFKIALQLNPNNQTAKHMLHSITKENPSQPPTNYVVDLFDQYAAYYNLHVKKKLQYNLPEKFRSLYAKHATAITANNTLDLGCGTGLCGIYFRDASINLIGIDISRNMLLHAKSSDYYDLLIQADLQNQNIFKDNHFNLIIAADVLPYIGKLEDFFLKIKNALLKNNNSKNIFLFNIELDDLTNNHKNLDFLLQTTGRYTHSIFYVEKLAKQFDFKILENITDTIRLQDDKTVMGTIFVLSN